jgi:hypothetical protein
MYDNWPVNALVVLVTAVSVALAVLVHYECLDWLSARLAGAATRQRRKVLYGIYAVIAIHIVEIWLFGLAFWVLLEIPGAGAVQGQHPVGLLDAVYLSAATFSTVGFGDLSPTGPLRFLAGTEALTGFILITWSASFTFLEMARFWRSGR